MSLLNKIKGWGQKGVKCHRHRVGDDARSDAD